jgi:lipopolysaccharide transport protein LptA
MKSRLLFLLLLGFAAVRLHAQPVAGGPTAETEIFADTFDFDMKSKVAIYQHNVRVIDPKMKLTCEALTAKLPEAGGKLDHIVAETNVVIDFSDDHGERSHAISDKAIYTYRVTRTETNEVIELTGSPIVERPGSTLTADTIIFDRANGRLKARGNVKIRTKVQTNSSGKAGGRVNP